MITLYDDLERRSVDDVAHLPCGGRCDIDLRADRALVELLVGDDLDGRAHAAAIWQHRWKIAARDHVWVPWGDVEPDPRDALRRCEVVGLFIELQRIWTAALFEHTGLVSADVAAASSSPVAFEAQRELLELLTDTDQRRSRSLRIMGHWTRLALTGAPATLAMGRHRLAGGMHGPWLNGMINITRRVRPRADAYVARRHGRVLPDRFVGLLPPAVR